MDTTSFWRLTYAYHEFMKWSNSPRPIYKKRLLTDDPQVRGLLYAINYLSVNYTKMPSWRNMKRDQDERGC